MNIYNDDHASTKYNEICKNSLKHLVSRTIILMFAIYLSAIIASINVIRIFFQTGKFYSLVGVLIPFVDEDSKAELYCNIAYLVVITLLIFFGLLYFQIVCGIIVDTMYVSSHLTILEMDELSDLLEQNISHRIETVFRVKRIILQILRIDALVESCSLRIHSLFGFNFVIYYLVLFTATFRNA